MIRLTQESRLSDKYDHPSDPFQASSWSRRLFLKQVLTLGTAGLVGSGLLAACGNGTTGERTEAETGVTGKTSSEAAAPEACEEKSELPAGEVASRQALNYVDKSPQAEKFCANCRFFKPPATGASCGGCEIVKGPISPEGYCTAWVAQG